MSASLKPKVLMVGPTRPVGGGIQTLVNDLLASSLTQRVELLLLDNSKRTRPGRPFVVGLLSQLRMVLELIGKVLRHRPQVVHIHSGGYNDFYRKSVDVLICWLLGRRVALHIHGGNFNRFLERRSRPGLAFVQFVFRRCRCILALSDYWRDLYKTLTRPERIAILNNCLLTKPFLQLPAKHAARAAVVCPTDRILVAFVGSMGHRKGVFDILDVAAGVAKAVPDILFALAGPDEGVERGAIEKARQIVAANDLANHVRILGPIAESAKLSLYAASDMFLLPSYAENSPSTILEAMASGVPVISTGVGAIPFVVRDGVDGLIVAPGDKPGIAEAIIRLARDPALRRTMGESGRERFFAHFALEERMVPRLAGIYQAIATDGSLAAYFSNQA